MFIPILVLAIISLLAGLLLTFASVFFSVKGEDERLPVVRDALPGANCGACGYSGCDGYAKALCDGSCDNPSLCVPGGDGVSREIAEIMGLTPLDIVERVAYVACRGCTPENKKFEYTGSHTCKAANMFYSGDRPCNFACLGYGDCMKVCPRDAIYIDDNGIAVVNPQKCIGCGLCTKACPNGIIHIVNDTSRVVVKCNSKLRGAEVRKICKNGCIACGKCVKDCPTEAITLVDNLATINYDKCIACGKCAEVCPVNCIKEGNFRCGSHFEHLN